MKYFLVTIVLAIFFTEANAQESWTSIFDGKTLSGWKRVTGNANFEVKDGAIVGTTVANSPNSFLVTENEYKDFILELDVQVDDTSMNSGIQVRSHFDPAGKSGKGLVYGCQFEIDPSSRKWSGGIYDEGRRDWLYPVSLHADVQQRFDAGRFHHVRIEYIGKEMKTWLDDIPIAYVADDMDRSGFIGLQVHAIESDKEAGKHVYFKNIRIQTSHLKPLPFPPGIYVMSDLKNDLLPYEKASGWNLLFDGQTTNGWVSAKQPKFPEGGWTVGNGTITVQSSEGKESANGGDIVTTGLYSAFDLSFDFKLTPGANSGVKYFVTLAEISSGSAIGLEYQVLDDSLHPDAKLGRDGDRTLASLYDLIPANKPRRFIHPIGQWNTGRVIVYPNNHVEHYLNGVKVLEYERGSSEFRSLVAQSKYKIWPNFGEAKEGHILLQDHGNEVSFRSIKIRSLR